MSSKACWLAYEQIGGFLILPQEHELLFPQFELLLFFLKEEELKQGLLGRIRSRSCKKKSFPSIGCTFVSYGAKSRFITEERSESGSPTIGGEDRKRLD